MLKRTAGHSTAIYKGGMNTHKMRPSLIIYLIWCYPISLKKVIMLHVTRRMGDNMAQVSQKIWKINMVGTIQANWTSAPMASYLKAHPMKKRAYEYKMWQHNTRSLVAAIWSDQWSCQNSIKLSQTSYYCWWIDEKENGSQQGKRQASITSRCAQAKHWLFQNVPPNW